MNIDISNDVDLKFHPPEYSWLFKGSQRSCNAGVTSSKVEAIRKKLEANCPEGVSFNPEKVHGIVTGGTCSAMSFSFIKKYLAITKESPEKLVESLISLRPLFEGSSEKMRDRQAAFNTIEVMGDLTDVDHSRNKIEALARYYHYHIAYASEEIVTTAPDCIERLQKELAQLPDGVYIVRILKPADNDKQEAHGHSMVYIRSKEHSFYYDPNNGAIELTHLDHAEIIYQSFKFCISTFNVSQARFYRIE